jgi:hypothetical protein
MGLPSRSGFAGDPPTLGTFRKHFADAFSKRDELIEKRLFAGPGAPPK